MENVRFILVQPDASIFFHLHALASRFFFGRSYFLLRCRMHYVLDSHWACVLARSSSCYCRCTIKLATSGGHFCESKYRLIMWGLFWTNLTVEASTFFHLRAMASRFFFSADRISSWDVECTMALTVIGCV